MGSLYTVLHGSQAQGCAASIYGTSGTIVSRNYPNNYPNNIVCWWLITVENRHTVELTFTDFDVEAAQDCTFDYVAVYDGANQNGTELMKFCGSTLPSPVKYRSNGNQMYIRMRTDHSVSGRGFKADFVADIDYCSPNPCLNRGGCTDGVNDYACTCVTGYTGKNCTTNIDDCSGVQCQNGGSCVDGVNIFTCNCAAGYTGQLCGSEDINDCSPNICNNGGTCIDAVNDYTCDCITEYTGKNCQTNIDDCDPNPCQNSGTCADGVNDYTCTCAAGYTGTNCQTNIDDCSPNPCQNIGACTDGVNDYTCTCAAGYTGENCQTNINDCSSNPCQNGGACTDGVNDYTCTCAAGYTGGNCQTNIDDCSPNPCQNIGACTDGINDYTCTCAAGYTGENCQTNINDCSPNPCKNGGTCADGVNDYTCTCAAGYTGENCQTNINDCSPNPCLNGGACIDRLNDFTCACNTGFSSKTCDKAALGASCSVQGTTCEKANAFCGTGTVCLCTSSYYDNDGTNNIGGTCTQKVVVGEICPSPTAAVPKTATCLDSVASCEQAGTTFRCTCPSTHYDDNGVTGYGGTCVRKKQLGDVCPSTLGESATCSDSNARCRVSGGSYRCQCIADTYDSDGTSNIGGTCLSKVELGSIGCSTTVTNSCKSPNAQCQINGGYCTCYSDFYDSNGGAGGGTCTQKIDLGQTGCSSSVTDSCKDGNADCLINDGTCTCKTGYYDDNGSTLKGTCRKKKELGESGCSTVVANSCKDVKSRCITNDGYCLCVPGYFDSNGDAARGTCESNKGLGKPCTGQSNECSDSAAQCLDDKCTCGFNYYDSDGFTDGGNCISVSELKVLAISFPSNSIGTSQFEVSWTPPTADKLAQISSFVVDWKLKISDNSLAGGNKEVSRTATSTIINTGITSGKTYIVTVTSKNAWTQSNVPRTTSLSEEQAVKPDIPRSLTTPDLNANDGTLSIGWSAPASGVTSGYRVRLLDGTNELTSLERSSSPVSISNSNIKNGYRYKIEIKARSEAYDGTNYVWSDKYEEQIKTVVQVPSAPRSVACDAIKDESVTLMWLDPEFPNGDLVKYIIQVLNANQEPQFNTSTSQVVQSHKIISLSPGTTYMFRVFAENEMYTSTSYGQSRFCMTKAKLSDPPTNLKTSAVSSRNFTVSWNEPLNTYSEEKYGYVFQLRNGDDCVKEVVYKCSNCLGTFQASSLENMCVSTVRDVISKTKTELSGLQSYKFMNMLPDTTYTISGTAVNNLGRGNVVTISRTTAEEAPQTPYNVEVSDIGITSFTVSWSIDEPRPGQTNFTVSLTADRPAPNKEVTLTDFNLRSYTAEGLEEYWNYSVTVTATTSVGAKTSDITQEYRTKPAAPGNVVDLKVTWALGGIYTLMQISWRAPTILSRNSVIKEYSLVTNSSGKTSKRQSLSHESDENHEYTVILNVIPEETYNFKVYATNVQDMKGVVTTVEDQAPAGGVKNAAVECDCYVQSLVVGAALGLLILILLVYAGYVSVLNRRYRQNSDQEINAASKNDRKSHTYMNESFMVGIADVGDSTNPGALSNVESGGESDTEYSNLDENTREDTTTYDTIKPSRR